MSTSGNDINEFIARIFHQNWAELIYRPFLHRILSATSERALIVLYGDGGCGKTTLLGLWAKEILQKPNGFPIRILPSTDVSQNCVVETVRRWGKFSESFLPNNNSERALLRLKNANENIRPLLYLGIDGIDEVTDLRRQDEIREILRWFWNIDQSVRNTNEVPSATLIITCREKIISIET